MPSKCTVKTIEIAGFYVVKLRMSSLLYGQPIMARTGKIA